MTDLNDIPDSILDTLTRPSIETLIRFFPERAYVHTVHWSECLEEEALLKLLLESGHPEWEHINLWGPVADIFEGRLWDLAEEHSLRPCRTASGRNQDGDLEIVFVFDTEADCFQFTLVAR